MEKKILRWYPFKNGYARLIFLLLLYVSLHALIALCASHLDVRNLLARLTYLDSNWYLLLAQYGYDGPSTETPTSFLNGSQYAFLPLWPAILHLMSPYSPPTTLALFGSLLSLSVLTTTLVMGCRFEKNIQETTSKNILYPTGTMAIAFLLFSPGGWVFFSNHTEALFIFLSFFAFHFAAQRRFLPATILSGLAALTRNQGILVAMTVGLFVFENANLTRRKKGLLFLGVGLGAGAFYASWLFYLYLKTGDIFASSRAQQNWRIASSWSDYLSNATWLSPNNAYRAALFWSVLGIGTWLLIKGRNHYKYAVPIGFYLISSALLWPLQGNNFPQAYRFSAVLFPFWNIAALMTSTLQEKMTSKWGLAFKLSIFSLLLASAGAVSWVFYNQIPNKWPY